MQTINQLEPTPILREDILKLHILYLEKCDSLSKGERNAYEAYLNHLANPQVVVSGDLDIKGI
jgi:hypothetical protein